MNKKVLIWGAVAVTVIGVIYYANKQSQARKAKTPVSGDSDTATTSEENMSNASGVEPISGGTNRYKCTSTGEIFNGGTYDQFTAFESKCKSSGGNLVALSQVRQVRNLASI